LSLLARRLSLALRSNAVQTAPDDPDPRLRGRTYAIPFDQVWEAALALAKGGLRGWKLEKADDYDGVIHATATTLVMRAIDDVAISISLDANGQTRVDMSSRSRKGVGDLGTNARRVAHFCRALDKSLQRARKAAAARKS